MCAIAHPAGLKAHFHDEVQVTLPAGRGRHLRLSSGAVHVRRGQACVIPPGCVHAGDRDDDPRGLNIYVPAALLPALPPGVLVVDGAPDREPATQPEAIVDWLRQVLAGTTAVAAVTLFPALCVCHRSAAPASGRRLGREAAIRRFARQTGTTPHRHGLVERLNRARESLARGDAPAAVAFATGFADQSHLGRHFKAAFGVSPAAYRLGMRSVREPGSISF